MARDLIAVYPGTFDPLTLGHDDIVRRALALFDQVVLAVARAHHKQTMFSLAQRIALARQALADYPTLTVTPFDGLLSDFVRSIGASVVVRGLRSVSDFDFEMQLAGMNRSLMPEVETVFLPPNEKFQCVSSSLIREIASLGGDVEKFVHPTVYRSLCALRQNKKESLLQFKPVP